jgi:hypothetical protein
MAQCHTSVVHPLTKRDVEALLSRYDADPVAALTVALRIVLGRPGDGFEALVTAAPLDDRRRRSLLERDVRALDELAQNLNESRMLTPPDRS